MSAPDMQAFSVQAAENGLARAGTLITARGAIRTPAALLYLRRGASLNLTPDMLDKLRPAAEGVQISAVQL